MFTFRRSAAVAVALLLLVPAAASAHQGNPNYESLYKGLSPKVPGVGRFSIWKATTGEALPRFWLGPVLIIVFSLINFMFVRRTGGTK